MKTFVLYRPEREARIRNVIADMGLDNVEYVLGPSAVDVKIPSDSPRLGGEVACWQGHRQIVARATQSNDMSLVLEDDVVPLDGWQKRLSDILWSAPKWDYINLGRTFAFGGVEIVPGLENGFSLTTHAYLLSSEGAKKYDWHFPPMTWFPVDWLPMYLRALGYLTVYTAKPRVFDQESLEGIIQPHVSQPEEWPDTKPKPPSWWLTGEM